MKSYVVFMSLSKHITNDKQVPIEPMQNKDPAIEI